MRVIALVVVVVGVIAAPSAVLAATYYVDAATLDDTTRTCSDTLNSATPWKTISKAMPCAAPGDTVMVASGTYQESVQSKVPGFAGAPIIVQSAVALGAIIQPLAGGNGVVVKHDYIVIDGFKVNGANKGIQIAPQQAGVSVKGIVIENNEISGSTDNGIQVTGGLDVEIAFNTVTGNGQNGISYSGNSSLIHDNIVSGNAQFGIYVKDGVDHQVYDNTATGNGTGADDDIKINGELIPSPAYSYYVDCAAGDDTRTATEAKDPASPWKTITRALVNVDGGDTVMVLPGTCSETVESQRDGSAGSVITVRAATPGTVTIDPPSGYGIVITHHYHSLVGLTVTGATIGMQLGPASGGAEIVGLVVNNCLVYGNTGVGVQFRNAVRGTVKHSVIHDNQREGIKYAGRKAKLFNNLVYSNGLGSAAPDYYYGVTIVSGRQQKVANNTIHGNIGGGVRLGTSSAFPVFGTVSDNIIASNGGAGIKEPANSTGSVMLKFNDVWNNIKAYDLAGSPPPGPDSISVDPLFIDPASADFRLSSQAAGQAVNSPAIDAGSATAELLNLGGRSAFTDNSPDTGMVDLGYHGAVVSP